MHNEGLGVHSLGAVCQSPPCPQGPVESPPLSGLHTAQAPYLSWTILPASSPLPAPSSQSAAHSSRRDQGECESDWALLCSKASHVSSQSPFCGQHGPWSGADPLPTWGLLWSIAAQPSHPIVLLLSSGPLHAVVPVWNLPLQLVPRPAFQSFPTPARPQGCSLLGSRPHTVLRFKVPLVLLATRGSAAPHLRSPAGLSLARMTCPDSAVRPRPVARRNHQPPPASGFGLKLRPQCPSARALFSIPEPPPPAQTEPQLPPPGESRGPGAPGLGSSPAHANQRRGWAGWGL